MWEIEQFPFFSVYVKRVHQLLIQTYTETETD